MDHRADEDQRLAAALEATIRRAGRPRRPKRLSDVVSRLLAKRGYANLAANEALLQAWTQAAGPTLANLSRPGRLRGGALEVVAATSVVVQELTFQKSALLSRLQQLAPEAKIRDLRFRQGALG